MQPVERTANWKRARIFFLTPQVFANDLNRCICPAQDVKCVIVDEAHKALGNHAYCQVGQSVFIITGVRLSFPLKFFLKPRVASQCFGLVLR